MNNSFVSRPIPTSDEDEGSQAATNNDEQRERERETVEKNSFVPLRVNRQTLTSNDEQWKAVMDNEKLTFKKQPVCLPLCRLTNPIPGLHPAAQHNPDPLFGLAAIEERPTLSIDLI